MTGKIETLLYGSKEACHSVNIAIGSEQGRWIKALRVAVDMLVTIAANSETIAPESVGNDAMDALYRIEKILEKNNDAR